MPIPQKLTPPDLRLCRVAYGVVTSSNGWKIVKFLDLYHFWSVFIEETRALKIVLSKQLKCLRQETEVIV